MHKGWFVLLFGLGWGVVVNKTFALRCQVFYSSLWPRSVITSNCLGWCQWHVFPGKQCYWNNVCAIISNASTTLGQQSIKIICQLLAVWDISNLQCFPSALLRISAQLSLISMWQNMFGIGSVHDRSFFRGYVLNETLVFSLLKLVKCLLLIKISRIL